MGIERGITAPAELLYGAAKYAGGAIVGRILNPIDSTMVHGAIQNVADVRREQKRLAADNKAVLDTLPSAQTDTPPQTP